MKRCVRTLFFACWAPTIAAYCWLAVFSAYAFTRLGADKLPAQEAQPRLLDLPSDPVFSEPSPAALAGRPQQSQPETIQPQSRPHRQTGSEDRIPTNPTIATAARYEK